MRQSNIHHPRAWRHYETCFTWHLSISSVAKSPWAAGAYCTLLAAVGCSMTRDAAALLLIEKPHAWASGETLCDLLVP